MLFNTQCTGKKRQMILLPDVNANSLLFFYERGNSGSSWSIRDYSEPFRVIEKYARDFGCSADDVRRRATFSVDAPTVDTNDLKFWHEYTWLGNRQVLKSSPPVRLGVPIASVVTSRETGQFPLLNSESFYRLEKSRKTGDMERMLSSPRSEDWVTWNLLNLLFLSHPDTWWPQVCAAAEKANPRLAYAEREVPAVHFWKAVPAPSEYEQRSRERMCRYSDPVLASRARDPRPVEGYSEIDVTFESPSSLVYVEAKLDSDISMRTTYDPARNQIIRNIDCLLESARGRVPVFWMFVRSDSPSHAYTQLMRKYQEDPATLAQDLPHRDPGLLREVAMNLTIITWRDIGEQICSAGTNDDEKLRSIKRELWRRIQ